MEGRCGGDIPISLEHKGRLGFPGLKDFFISGRIDRIDKKGAHLHVFDYKSGQSRTSRLQREIILGYRMQPVLYPWIASGGEEEEPRGDFSYIFLGDSPPTEKVVRKSFDVENFLKPMAETLRQGIYLPTPTETMELAGITNANPCQFCQFDSLCRRFDRGADRRYFKFLKRKLVSRWHNFSRVKKSRLKARQ